MALFSEIRKALSAEAGVFLQFTVVGEKGGYFQNVARVLEFSEQRIVLAGKKERITVEGTGLSLGRYGSGDALILGNIAKIERA